MVTAKSLVEYKQGYNPDGKKKHKSIGIDFDNGAKETFDIPIVSGNKGVEFQVSEQLQLYDSLATSLVYTGPQKFDNYSTYLSGAFKSAWENELNADHPTGHQRTVPGFKRALRATWSRFYGETDLRKGALKMLTNLKWKKVFQRYEHTPTQFAQRVETLYALVKELDEDPGITPMPTLRMQNEDLVESFPKDYQTYFEVRSGDYTLQMSAVGQLLEDHYDREKEESSDDDDTDDDGSDDSSDDDDSSSDDDSDSDNEKKKKKKKSRKRKAKKAKKKTKKSKRKKTKKVKVTTKKFGSYVKPTDPCPIHNGHHIWGKCRFNPRGENYDPPKPYGTQGGNSNGQYNGYRGGQQNGNYQGRNSNSNQQGQRNQGQQYFNNDQQQQQQQGPPQGQGGRNNMYHFSGGTASQSQPPDAPSSSSSYNRSRFTSWNE